MKLIALLKTWAPFADYVVIALLLFTIYKLYKNSVIHDDKREALKYKSRILNAMFKS